MKIGVFDSGLGGLYMASVIETALPDHEIVLREDKANVPYGIRPPEEILQLVTPIFEELVKEGCEVIVVACNTVSTTLMQELRKLFKVPLVAIEPMVKLAADMTKSGVIAVCATPTTLASQRYKWLKMTFAGELSVLEPDCADWASMIEHNQIDNEKIKRRIDFVLDSGADVIVLACTHYHWIESRIKELASGRAIVMQPEASTVVELKQVLARLA